MQPPISFPESPRPEPPKQPARVLASRLRELRQARERGLALESLQDYLNFFRYGCPPHGGMGVGLARLLMVMLQRPSVRDVILLSRTPNRLTP